jgi:translation initiation factor eIF-2B subunit epsilon
MSQKKSRGGAAAGDDADELSRSPLQAVLLADSFTLKFRPITLERPKVPHPAPPHPLPRAPPPLTRLPAYPRELN